jgi:hypothetical protein
MIFYIPSYSRAKDLFFLAGLGGWLPQPYYFKVPSKSVLPSHQPGYQLYTLARSLACLSGLGGRPGNTYLNFDIFNFSDTPPP